MAAEAEQRAGWSIGRIEPAIAVRQLRLYSGLVLFAYVLTHLVNHAFGLLSLELLEASRLGFIGFWRLRPVTWLLYGAVLTHLSLALWSLYARRSLAGMRWWEVAQLGLGLCIPPLLIEHVVGNRLAHELYGVEDSYTRVLFVMWVAQPDRGLLQIVALVVAWLHVSVGLHFWLRLRAWYGRAVPYLYASALIIPMLAILGFIDSGMDVVRLADDPVWLEALRRNLAVAPAAVAHLYAIRDGLYWTFGGLLAATLAARFVRQAVEARSASIDLTYPDGRRARIAHGVTVLEASRMAGIPHASVCGGRGRCSTCRVRVGAGADRLPPPGPEETKVLARVGAPPNVRLACQIRPAHHLEVTPLLPPSASPREALARPDYMQGRERDIAVLFADLRGFTRLAEHRLPYDVVFLLNRYFAEMGRAVESSGGRLDKFIGDGVMALFGIERGLAAGARAALATARQMAANLEALNRGLGAELGEPLRIGIGIHGGPCIVGEMGYRRATSLTAIGDTVNTAARLEALTKEFAAQLVVSETVVKAAGLELAPMPRRMIDIRGRSEPLCVVLVEDALALPGDLAAAGPEAPAAESRARSDGIV